MNIKERNKQIKKVLSDVFGAKNVSVRAGKGTAYGWVDIDIVAGARISVDEQYTETEKNIINETCRKAEKILSDSKIEFYKYSDDMGKENKMYVLQCSLI